MRLRISDGGHAYLDMWLEGTKLRIRRMPSGLNRSDLNTLRRFLDEVATELATTNPDHDNVIDDQPQGASERPSSPPPQNPLPSS